MIAPDPIRALRDHIVKARDAVTQLRDHARQAGMDHHRRDPLVVAIHKALDGVDALLVGETPQKHPEHRGDLVRLTKRVRECQLLTDAVDVLADYFAPDPDPFVGGALPAQKGPERAGVNSIGADSGGDYLAQVGRPAPPGSPVAAPPAKCAVRHGGFICNRDLGHPGWHYGSDERTHAVRTWLPAGLSAPPEAPPPPERMFPIMSNRGPKPAPIPWRCIAPHEDRAQRNHKQSLEQLARRGGLSPCEAVAILEDRKWHEMPDVDSEARLRELTAALAAVPPGPGAAEMTDLKEKTRLAEMWLENVRRDGDGRSLAIRFLATDVIALVAEVERLRALPPAEARRPQEGQP